MTDEKATLLMNQYFADDAADEELQELFLHLSTSKRSRSRFSALKRVNDSLLRTEDVAFPAALDRRLSFLGLTEKQPSLLQRKYSFSLASAVLSTLMIGLVSVIIFSLFSRSLVSQKTLEQQSLFPMQSVAGAQLEYRQTQ
jgi:hypothetical protein